MKNYIKPEIEIMEFINETEVTVLHSSNYNSLAVNINEKTNVIDF